MIIEVRQKKSNLGKEFQIKYDGELRYRGEQGGYSAYAPNRLYSPDDHMKLESRITKRERMRVTLRVPLMNLLFGAGELILFFAIEPIPLRILAMVLFFLFPALFPRKTSPANVRDNNDKRIARFYHRNRGLLTAYDVIEESGKKYKVYNVARGRYLYLSVYCDGRQIAQINKDLHTVNNKDNYTLYLLDDDVESADMLSLFVLYYDSLNHGNQGEVFVGVKKNWSWTWSKTDRFYNEDWLPTHIGVYALEKPD